MSIIPFPNCRRVSSLSEIYSYIRTIQIFDVGISGVKNGILPPLWFRGHEEVSHFLLPTLLRKNKVATHTAGAYATHSTIQTQENQRHNVFRAKLNHFFSYSPGPCNELEWQELMQHYAMHTRMLDWSESLHSALAFALRSILNPSDDVATLAKRSKISPVLWILIPANLNDLVYTRLCDAELIEHAVESLNTSIRRRTIIRRTILDRLLAQREIYFDLPPNNQQYFALNHVINLSVIDQHRATCASSLASLLESGEYNPFHFMLSRYYSDVLPASQALPPLATLHPYHSDRIRAQHGAFTIFPVNTAYNSSRSNYSVLNAMENTVGMDCCLFEIRITDAYRVAHELLLSGVRESNLFPEPEVFAKEFQAERYFY